MQRSLLFVALLSPFLASAQLRFGNRAGMSLTTQMADLSGGLEGSYFGDLKYAQRGFAGAATLEIPVHGVFHLNAEVGYSERGYSYDVVKGWSGHWDYLKTSYAGLSVLPKARIGKGRVMLEVFLGGDIAWRVRTRDEWQQYMHIRPAVAITPMREDTREDLMRTSALSAIAGVGAAIKAGVALLHIDARYMHGISPVYATDIAFTDGRTYSFGTGNMYDRGFLFSIGYSVPLSAKAWQAAQ